MSNQSNHGIVSFWSVLSLISCFVMLAADTVEKKDDKPKPPPQLVIRIRLDRDEVAVEEAVRLTGMISKEREAEVRRVSHEVLRIGRYDPASETLVNMEKGDFRELLSLRQYFNGLPGDLIFTHPPPFEITNPREKGMEFEFIPKKIGIFLIRTEWHLRGEADQILSSNPVILVVRPPYSKDKRMIIKPEWLSER